MERITHTLSLNIAVDETSDEEALSRMSCVLEDLAELLRSSLVTSHQHDGKFERATLIIAQAPSETSQQSKEATA